MVMGDGVYRNCIFRRISRNGPTGSVCKRWGTNRAVVTDQTVTVDMGGSAGFQISDIFSTLFNLNDTSYEAGLAI